MLSYKFRLIFFTFASCLSVIMCISHLYIHDGSGDSIKFCLVILGFNLCMWIENRFINMGDYIQNDLDDGIDWQKNYHLNTTVHFFMGPLLPGVALVWIVTLIFVFEINEVILIPLTFQAIREYFIIIAKKKDKNVIQANAE